MDRTSLELEQSKHAVSLMPDLIEAALQHDRNRVQSISLSAIRSLRKRSPQLADRISTILAGHKAGLDPLRLAEIDPPPTDRESSIPLLKVEAVREARRPVFEEALDQHLSRFIHERKEAQKLLAEGFLPPRSMLLKGPPGTGKTMCARWIASHLGLKLATLDVATSISSLLGSTGLNLRRALDYARATPCVLLLDEFDSIAKKRDDSTDVGELKRIVNVLLKELEDWPYHSILLAATNHPDLLDSAIGRRFDRIIDITLPPNPQRAALLSTALGHFAKQLSPPLLHALAVTLEAKSGADIERLATAAARRHIVAKEPLIKALISELSTVIASNSADGISQVLRALKEHAPGSFTVRELADAVGRSPATVQYHLTKKVKYV